MARSPDERVKQAHEMFLKGVKLVEIASQLKLPEGTVRRWKSVYKWGSERSDKNSERSKKKGGQPKNKNAVGNDGGAPVKNNNAVKHGLFEKYLPQETLDIVKNMSLNPLDILWDQIQIAYAAIVRAQQIAYVRDHNDKTINKVGEKFGNVSGEEWEVQEAWDKQSKFMQSQARAQSELRSLIKQYDEMLHNNWEASTEEQQLRIKKLQLDIQAQTGGSNGTDGVQDFLKAIKPTQEDIDALYRDEVNDNAEEE